MCKQAESSSSAGLAFHVNSLKTYWTAWWLNSLWRALVTSTSFPFSKVPKERNLHSRYSGFFLLFLSKQSGTDKTWQWARIAGQTFKWWWFWRLRIAVLKMKDVVSISFHVALLSLSLSRSLCLTPMVCYKMWPVDVHLGTKKNTLFICFQFHLNDYSPWSRSCSLSFYFFLTLLHFSAPFFHFLALRIAPTQGRPAIP